MKTILKRALCAALPLCLAHAPALAADREVPLHPAIAAGLNIPVGSTALPSGTQVPAMGRYVVVDAASAQLFMIENGKVVDSMKVIVGKPTSATPSVRSTIYYATLNPYWNVPVDLARTIIAPRVLAEGPHYLEKNGYQVVSGFTRDAELLDSKSIDWRAVADGRETVHVRQLPGPGNFMGQVKFGFGNKDGIFLHDTPKKELFHEADRRLSNGCVRLEDAARLARWMLGRDPATAAADPEHYVPLPQPVHVVITYIDPVATVQVAALR
ncbi:MAG TPA: L,D-transpeptidase family protein [Sphingomicrobium sp.]|nr:L,D-transpeptidase family protein [Sphingomicrobium sp.]